MRKKIVTLLITAILLFGFSGTAYAATSCPPHGNIYSDVAYQSYGSGSHFYNTGLYVNGQPIQAVCSYTYSDITYKVVCGNCGAVLNYDTAHNEYHSQCGR